MEQNYDHENTCERYLLGELSEQEQTQLEEEYFANDALFERFLAVKDDLIDAYARGELAADKRRRFEKHFLASRPRQERVEEAKGFIRAVSAHPTVAAQDHDVVTAPTQNMWWQQLLSFTTLRPLVWRGALVAILVIAVGGSWVLVRRFQDQRFQREQPQNQEAADRRREEERKAAMTSSVAGVELTRKPTVTPSPDSTPHPKSANKQPLLPMPAQVASLFLTPFSPRDATASNSLLLHPQTRTVRLQLAFTGDEYRRYDAVLRTLDGKQVFSRRGLRVTPGTTGRSVTIALQPAMFDRQDYIITLHGLTADDKLEAIGDYYFRVERTASQ